MFTATNSINHLSFFFSHVRDANVFSIIKLQYNTVLILAFFQKISFIFPEFFCFRNGVNI